MPRMADSLVVLVNSDDMTLGLATLYGATSALSGFIETAFPDCTPPNGPSPLAISPDRSMLYAGYRGAQPAVLSFEIDYADKTLHYRGRAPLPDSMAHIATDSSGRYLFSASYASGKFAINTIDADGIAGDVLDVFDTGPRAHCVVPSKDNRTIFVSSTQSDAILRYGFDDRTGRLSPYELPAMRTRTGSGPRHFVFDAKERFAYVVNQEAGTVDVFGASSDGSGSFDSIQTVDITKPGFSGAPEAADIHLTPDGRFLYASERTSNTLSGFAVNDKTGRLTEIQKIDVPPTPRGFAIDPSGRHLLVAGQFSANIALYAIDPQTGVLTLNGTHPTGHGPNWIEILLLPIASSSSRPTIPSPSRRSVPK